MRLIKIDIVKQIIQELPTPIKSNVMTAYDTLIQEGRKEGKIEGRKEGKIEGFKDVILNGWKKGATIEFLADITGLSIKEVEDIVKGYKPTGTID